MFFVLFALSAVGWTQDPKQQAPPSTVREAYLQAYNTHDTGAVLALYADDAVLLSEAGIFRGRDEIRKWLKFAIDQGSILESISPVREKSSGTLAYGTGETKRLVGNEVHFGRYLLVMELQNGKWRIVEHASFSVHN